jgi:hypothetical protein
LYPLGVDVNAGKTTISTKKGAYFELNTGTHPVGNSDERNIVKLLSATGGNPAVQLDMPPFAGTTKEHSGTHYMALQGDLAIPQQNFERLLEKSGKSGSIVIDGRKAFAVSDGKRVAGATVYKLDNVNGAIKTSGKEPLTNYKSTLQSTKPETAYDSAKTHRDVRTDKREAAGDVGKKATAAELEEKIGFTTEQSMENKLFQRADEHGIDIAGVPPHQEEALALWKGHNAVQFSHLVEAVTKPINEAGFEGMRQTDNPKVLGYTGTKICKPGLGIASVPHGFHTANIPVLDEQGNAVFNQGKASLKLGASGKPIIVLGKNQDQLLSLARSNRIINIHPDL